MREGTNWQTFFRSTKRPTETGLPFRPRQDEAQVFHVLREHFADTVALEGFAGDNTELKRPSTGDSPRAKGNGKPISGEKIAETKMYQYTDNDFCVSHDKMVNIQQVRPLVLRTENSGNDDSKLHGANA